MARGPADAAAAGRRRRWTGRASSRSRCSTEKQSDGDIFLAPALSSDGKHDRVPRRTATSLRGQVFIDLWLGDAETGKRIARLVQSTFDPNFEELRLLYSQSAFSPDGQTLAFTAQRRGKDVLYLFDVADRARAATHSTCRSSR